MMSPKRNGDERGREQIQETEEQIFTLRGFHCFILGNHADEGKLFPPISTLVPRILSRRKETFGQCWARRTSKIFWVQKCQQQKNNCGLLHTFRIPRPMNCEFIELRAEKIYFFVEISGTSSL